MKKVILLLIVTATLFACTKDSSVSQYQTKGRKQVVLTTTQLTTTSIGTTTGDGQIDTAIKVDAGTQVYFTVSTPDSLIMATALWVKSDSTLGNWSVVGKGSNGDVTSPFSSYVTDTYAKQFPQLRIYKVHVVTNKGWFDTPEFAVQ